MQRPKRSIGVGVCVLASLLVSLFGSLSQSRSEESVVPPRQETSAVADPAWVVEKTGTYLPMATSFTDEQGQVVQLGEYITRPTLLLPIYFYCPSSCSQNLANLAVALNRLSFEPGRDFRVIAISFNDQETAADAKKAKKNYLKLLYDQFPETEWTFLTGDREAIEAVMQAIGYRYQKMDDLTYIHPSALVVTAADGKIVRYVYGSFVSGDIDLALANAQSGIVSLSVKRVLDFCFNYDPKTHAGVVQWVKIAVLLFFIVTGILLFLVYRGKSKDGDTLRRRLSGDTKDIPL